MAQATPRQFTVPDMDCNGCVASITAAIRQIDPQASVAADLASKHVVVVSLCETVEVARVIEEAGFSVSTL